MNAQARRNAATFGPGTFGRDMVYTLVSLYLVYYVTEVDRPGDVAIWWLTGILLVARLFDAVMDFVMGSVVERTRTRWGQFKPWIAIGAVTSGLATVLLFGDPGQLTGAAFIVVFALSYLLWGLTFTTNDIPYWSLLPALTVDQREREVIGSVAKVFGTLGLLVVASGTLPAAGWLSGRFGGEHAAWLVIAAIAAGLMIVFQLITLLGVRQPPGPAAVGTASPREIIKILRSNDQVLWVAVCMTLFMAGFQITTTFGPYFFKYAWRDAAAYPTFAAMLAVAQLVGFLTFPLLSGRLGSRMTTFTVACATVFVGYVLFLVSPHRLGLLTFAGFLMCLGQAYVVMLTILLLSDTVEYGHWKTGERHGSITFALQPFIYKASAALATAVVAATTVLTGISRATTPADVSPAGVLGLRVVMLVVPLVAMIVAYVLLRRHYVIDRSFYERIITDLRRRGELEPAPDFSDHVPEP